jgi:hypothetical protein
VEKAEKDNGGDDDQCKHPSNPVDNDTQEDTALRFWGLAHGVENLDEITTRASRQKEVIKHADHDELPDTEPGKGDALHAHQQLPTEGTADQNEAKTGKGGYQPEGISLAKGLKHLGAIGRIVKNPPKQKTCDRGLNERDEDLIQIHMGKCVFHCSTAAMIASGLARGESSRV